PRCPRTRDKHRTDHQVGVLDGVLYVQLCRVTGADATTELDVQLAQLAQVDVEHRDMSAHSAGHPSGVVAGGPAADHHHVCRADTGRAAHQYAAAPGLHQVICADLRGEPP